MKIPLHTLLAKLGLGDIEVQGEDAEKLRLELEALLKELKDEESRDK